MARLFTQNKDNDYEAVKDVIEKVWDYWMEEGNNRERLGELIKRKGFQKLLEVTGLHLVRIKF